MYLSKFFFRSQKKVKDSKENVYQKMIRASMIFQNGSGFYTYLPLGMRILKKFESWIINEMEAIGFSNIRIPFLISTSLLKKSDRLEKFGKHLFYTKDYKGKDFILGATYEESIAAIFKPYISSYRDFPINVFQIGTKFRNEYRSKFGLIRTMEFLMKDAYSLHLSDEDTNFTYELVKKTYKKIFEKCNLKIKIVIGDSGIMGGDSEEFMFSTPFGEDHIIICQNCNFSENIENKVKNLEIQSELNKPSYICSECKSNNVEYNRLLELGHIFKLNKRYSISENLFYVDKNSQKKIPTMNSYGLGISRLLLTILEEYSVDDKIILPFFLCPFEIILIPLLQNTDIQKISLSIYNNLNNKIIGKIRISVLLDDRDMIPSIKFKDADLMGIPIHIIIGKKEIAKNEVKLINNGYSQNFPMEGIEKIVEKICIKYQK